MGSRSASRPSAATSRASTAALATPSNPGTVLGVDMLPRLGREHHPSVGRARRARRRDPLVERAQTDASTRPQAASTRSSIREEAFGVVTTTGSDASLARV